jgi:hypothetical protein
MISVVDQNRNLIQYAEFTIRYHPEKSEPAAKSYYGTTYAPDMLNGAESAGLGELPPGNYRIAVNANGKLYERWVEVKSGKLTRIVFVVK